MKNVLSGAVNFKVRNIIREFIKSNNSPIIVTFAKDDYLSEGGFNIYIQQDNKKIWVDSSKQKSRAENKIKYIEDTIYDLVNERTA